MRRHPAFDKVAAGLVFAFASLFLTTSITHAGQQEASGAIGRSTYQYYCYQCHGYGGDARTLASTYLNPKPRDFTSTRPTALSREAMREAISSGRPGTAMVSFRSVLTPSQIEAVIGYIRTQFMVARPAVERYHTPANGWKSHERYRVAFPFATGEIPLDRPWESLTVEQRQGKRLFLASCVTCHDRANITDEGPIWESQAVSYPRRPDFQVPPPFSGEPGRAPDSVSAASPYGLHDSPPPSAGLTPAEKRGQDIYFANCAFCHAPDGSGRNWIGSFLIPRPRDLNHPAVRQRDAASLGRAIANGMAGTSMPAWKDVLNESQIGDVVSYIKRTTGPGPARANGATDPRHTSGPMWERAQSRDTSGSRDK